MKSKIDSFNFEEGKLVLGKYTIISKLGKGWEGEVYKVEEKQTGIIRAAKFFYPKRNANFKVSSRYARKLSKLNSCPIIMNYHSHDIMNYKSEKVACLITEFIHGIQLSDFIKRHRGGKIGIFQGLHLLYSIVKGLESIHLNGEYHGDLHLDNVIITKFGLGFDIKIIDFHHWGDSKKDNRDEDIIKLIRIFYEVIGGDKTYKNHPIEVKDIIKGMKRGLILKQFKTASALRLHLETFNWKRGNV